MQARAHDRMILTPIPDDQLAGTLDRFMAGLSDRFSRVVFARIPLQDLGPVNTGAFSLPPRGLLRSWSSASLRGRFTQESAAGCWARRCPEAGRDYRPRCTCSSRRPAVAGRTAIRELVR